MDEGMGLDTPTAGRQMGVELDLSGLLRMDQATQIKTLTEGVKGGLWTPNEARSQVDAAPLAGGDTVYLQQQYYSLEALADHSASGFVFHEFGPQGLREALRRAFELARHPAQWRAVQTHAMRLRFDWRDAARAYGALYRRLTDAGGTALA